MKANRIYLIRGSSAANSPFFECENDCKYFLQLVDRFLKSYLHVNCFQNNKDGWVMIVTTKSADDIRQAYKARRAKSKKCKKRCEHKEVWRMLSDQIRILLSTYVKTTNRITGRKGGKVRCNYERFVFESVEEALQTKEMMDSQRYEQAQPMKRYRPARKLHKIGKQLGRVSPYLSCAALVVPKKLAELGLQCLDLMVFVSDVLRQLIEGTIQHHFPT